MALVPATAAPPGDFIGTYVEFRRSFEGQMLALAALHSPATAGAWLKGRQPSPRDLRVVVASSEPGAAAVVQHLYGVLSAYAHGHVESAGAYANRWGRFE